MSLAHASGDPFEALGDANRREILNLLGPGEKSVRELADALPISRPAVSRHLRLLKQAGLVAERPSGTLRLYRLQEQGVEVIQAYLRQVWGETAARFTLLAENTRSHSESDQRSASNQSRSESTRSQ